VPDWHNLVRKEMEHVQLPPEQKEEIAFELATHLDELYEERRALGWPEAQSIERTGRVIPDWAELRRRVQRAKREERTMNSRTRQLWLPGLASFWTAMACELALGGGPRHGGSLSHSHLAQLKFGLWLIAQFACGALGAYLSRRAGGRRSARLAAGLFTSLVWLTAMLMVLSICAIARAMGLGFAALDLTVLLKPVLVVALVPSVAMLAGALPFLSTASRPGIAR
jgi:hypothetical protein